MSSHCFQISFINLYKSLFATVNAIQPLKMYYTRPKNTDKTFLIAFSSTKPNNTKTSTVPIAVVVGGTATSLCSPVTEATGFRNRGCLYKCPVRNPWKSRRYPQSLIQEKLKFLTESAEELTESPQKTKSFLKWFQNSEKITAVSSTRIHASHSSSPTFHSTRLFSAVLDGDLFNSVTKRMKHDCNYG